MKKIIIILMMIIVSFLYGCSSGSDEYYSEYNKDDIDPYDAMEIAMNAYTFEEIADHYDESIVLGYVYEQLGAANMPLIIEELEGNEMYDEIENLFVMADKIGYYSSAIYGNFCIDNRNYLIHLTDSNCVSNIPFENRRSVVTMNLDKLKTEIEDDDTYLSGHSLCDLCFPE